MVVKITCISGNTGDFNFRTMAHQNLLQKFLRNVVFQGGRNNHDRKLKEDMRTTINVNSHKTSRAAKLAALTIGCLATATLAAPAAFAAPDCSGPGVANTVSTVTGSAQQYLANHPGAGNVLYGAANQPAPQAEANIRSYFTANPTEYYELRGILAPIGDTQQQCGVTVLPPNLATAYAQFMAG
jgi:hemophore-related protein